MPNLVRSSIHAQSGEESLCRDVLVRFIRFAYNIVKAQSGEASFCQDVLVR